MEKQSMVLASKLAEKMRRVQIFQTFTGKMFFVPIDEVLYKEGYSNSPPKKCDIIVRDEPYGWWVNEKIVPGGASDGIGDSHIVRDFNNADFDNFQNGKVAAYVTVDHNNKLEVPMNGMGDGKIDLFLIPLLSQTSPGRVSHRPEPAT